MLENVFLPEYGVTPLTPIITISLTPSHLHHLCFSIPFFFPLMHVNPRGASDHILHQATHTHKKEGKDIKPYCTLGSLSLWPLQWTIPLHTHTCTRHNIIQYQIIHYKFSHILLRFRHPWTQSQMTNNSKIMKHQ